MNKIQREIMSKILSKKQSYAEIEWDEVEQCMVEYAKIESIQFLDEVRAYIKESQCNILSDERTSEEFYKIYKLNS